MYKEYIFHITKVLFISINTLPIINIPSNFYKTMFQIWDHSSILNAVR